MAEQISGSFSPAHYLGSLLGSLYLSFVGHTTRVSWLNREAADSLEKAGQNFIYVTWHSRQVFLVFTHRGKKACALVSQSKDGEYMARILKRFGMEVVRGSTSKGGPQALLGLMDYIKAGYHAALTPDGPRGPQGRVQQGALLLAQKTGLPVIPLTCGLSRKIVFGSWDGFQFPLPFGRAAVVYGSPVLVKEEDSFEAKAAELEAALNRITKEADALVRS